MYTRAARKLHLAVVYKHVMLVRSELRALHCSSNENKVLDLALETIEANTAAAAAAERSAHPCELSTLS